MYTQVLLCLVGILTFVWYRRRRKCFRLFMNLGIPGPEPNILFGNYLEITRKGPIRCQKEWVKKYGKVFGYYYGTKPILLVSDVNLLKNVLIKDFQKFTDRSLVLRALSQPLSPGDPRHLHLISLKGAKWKYVRSLITPSFSTGKMKQMSPIIHRCIDSFMDNIEEKRLIGKPFDLRRLLRGLTLDIVARTALGMETNVQTNPKDPFLELATLIFFHPLQFFSLLAGSKIGGRLFRIIVNKGRNPVEELLDICETIVKARKSDLSLKQIDLLQLLIDAEMKEDEKVSDSSLAAGEENERQYTNSDDIQEINKDRKKRTLTNDEIAANAFSFLLSGFETTSTALAFTYLMLANYPEVQEKIRSEVNDVIGEEGKLTYESVNRLEYLDQVFCEVLRLYPPVYQAVNREPTENVIYDNIRIPKGMSVHSATYLLHYDPDYWPDPHEFKPERFSPDNRRKHVPLAWQPFGAGPRNCVGMRFAQMMSKLAIGRSLHKYKLLPTKETNQHPLDLSVSPVIIRPKYGVPIRVELA